ncbi:mitochondrial substrate carrier family protein [Hibiscus syriacus]|uniref:Mitochondrial substrate carrier family protein n=1 Tax=Hibiscus syriacus TaxID=106335 RepID=A0A6A2ZRR7_HIBSY|nr:mitochondrial substrate carrier family protein [Hibiscus syriacus]
MKETRIEGKRDSRRFHFSEQFLILITKETVAVVTGANRGIGYEIARQLAGHRLTVTLTSRDSSVGIEAAKVIQDLGFNVDVHQLDILDSESISAFIDWIKQKYGGVDILVNNAGVNYNLGYDNSVEFARQVIETNYYGTKNMIKAMIPVMRPSAVGARIVNVSSRLGRLNGRRNRIQDANLREKLTNLETLSEELIDRTVSSSYKKLKMKHGNRADGLKHSVSKLAVNAYTRLLAKELYDQSQGEKIYVNCYCPGWVKTAMTGWQGNISRLTPESGLPCFWTQL